MGFFLFLLVTATLLIRPAEQIPDLRGVRLYECLILLCFGFSFSAVLEQFSVRSLEARPITVCVLGLLLAVVLSQLAQGHPEAAGDAGFEFFKVVVYYILLVGNITSTLRLRVFVVCLGLCSLTFVTLAMMQYHELITLPAPEPLQFADKSSGSDAGKEAFVKDKEYDPVSGQMVEFKRLRGTGIFRDPNDLSLLLTTGFFIALFAFTDRPRGFLRFAWLIPLVFFLYALSLTYSRGGLLSMFAGCLALFYARYGWRGTLMLGLPLLPLTLMLFGGRMTSISATEGTGQSRVQIWSDGFAALQSSPLFGVGMHEMGVLIGQVAHNSFLEAYAELGLFGGTFFFGAFFFALLTLQQMLGHGRQSTPQHVGLYDPELLHLLPFLWAMLVSYAVGILSLSRVDTVPTYLLLGLVSAFGGIATQWAPAFRLRLDSRLVQRMVLASFAFLAASYMFIRVFRV
jgi:hypothetical protein